MITIEDTMIQLVIERVEHRGESFRDAAKIAVTIYSRANATNAEKELLIDTLAAAAHGRRLLRIAWESATRASVERWNAAQGAKAMQERSD